MTKPRPHRGITDTEATLAPRARNPAPCDRSRPNLGRGLGEAADDATGDAAPHANLTLFQSGSTCICVTAGARAIAGRTIFKNERIMFRIRGEDSGHSPRITKLNQSLTYLFLFC